MGMLAWICGKGGVPIIGLNMFLNPGDMMKNALDKTTRCLSGFWTWLPDYHLVKECRIGLKPALRLMILHVCVCVCLLTPLAFRTAHLLLALPPPCPLYVP